MVRSHPSETVSSLSSCTHEGCLGDLVFYCKNEETGVVRCCDVTLCQLQEQEWHQVSAQCVDWACAWTCFHMFCRFHHMYRSSTFLFCRRQRAWTCTFKPLHYGTECRKPSYVTRQNGMLGLILTSWFLFNSSSWVFNRVVPSVWRHQNTEVNAGKGWEISSEGWVLKIERPSYLKGQRWTKHSLPPTHHPFHCSCSPGSKLDQKKPGWPACPGGNSSVPERGAWTGQCLGRWSQRWGKAFWGKHAGTYIIRIIDHNSGPGVTLKSSLWPRARKNSKKYRLAATGWNQNTNATPWWSAQVYSLFLLLFFPGGVTPRCYRPLPQTLAGSIVVLDSCLCLQVKALGWSLGRVSSFPTSQVVTHSSSLIEQFDLRIGRWRELANDFLMHLNLLV